MTLAGLRSRWSTPRSWAAERPAQSLAGDLQALVVGQSADAAEEGGEIFAVDVFHGDELLALEFADVEDAADVGMGDLAGEADFVVEAVEPGLVLAEEGGEKFEGDRLVEREIVGAVDLAHAAAAEKFDDAVAARRRRCPP